MKTKYKQNQIELECIQYTQEILDEVLETKMIKNVPEWLKLMCINGCYTFATHCNGIVRSYRKDYEFVVGNLIKGKEIHFNLGDYIIRDVDDSIKILTEEQFSRRFKV